MEDFDNIFKTHKRLWAGVVVGSIGWLANGQMGLKIDPWTLFIFGPNIQKRQEPMTAFMPAHLVQVYTKELWSATF